MLKRSLTFIAVLFLLSIYFPEAASAKSESALAQLRKPMASISPTTQKENLENPNRPVKERVETKLTDIRKKNVRHLFGQMLARLTATTARLERLIVKIESKLGEDSELNTSAAQANLESAKALIEEAKTNMANLKIQLENLVISETPKDEFLELKGLVEDIKRDLQEAHRLLVKAMVTVKRVDQVKQ